MLQRRLKRMEQLLLLKEQKTQEAAKQWLHAREQFRAGKAKHDQLLQYRIEYMQQLQELGDSGGTAARIRNRVNFIAQLDVALSQMNQQLAELAKQRTFCEKNFLHAKAEQDVVMRLIERIKMQKATKEARLEQKESDEHAQKQWYSKKPTANADKRSD